MASTSSPDAVAMTQPGRLQELGRSILVNLLIVAVIAILLWLNVLDVQSTSVRLLYGAMAGWLVLVFFLGRFRSWKLARSAAGQSPEVGWLSGWLKAVDFCLSLLMLLLASEAVARTLPPMSNSSTNYPGSRFVWPDRYAPRNHFGLNDAEPRNPDARPKILVLGDSYVEGAGVSRQERFCSRLQASLRKGARETQVVAGGNCGWNTQDEERFLQRFGDELRPDVVVVAYVLNDAEGAEHLALQPNRWELWLQTRLRSYLCYRLFRWRRAAMSQYWDAVRRQHRTDSPGWQAVAASLKNIQGWCWQRKIPCQLAVLPIFTHDADAGREVMNEVVSRAKELGFHSYQTLDDFEGRWIDFAVSPHDAHPNAAGHERLAKRMESELRATVSRMFAP